MAEPSARPGLGFAIKAVTLCYDLSNASSFISQVRLSEETLPPNGFVLHDDPTDLTSVVSVCVESPVGISSLTAP